jgi:hypothetical protein
MKSSTILSCLLVFILFGWTPAGAADAPAGPKAAGHFQLGLDTVSGIVPLQWVFTVVFPGGYVGVVAPRDLRRYVKAQVPAGATLKWAPGCCRLGREPLLSSQAEMKSFEEFLRESNIHFVLVPSG